MTTDDQLWMLYGYAKSRKEDLTQGQLKTLRDIVERWKIMNNEMFNELLESIKEMDQVAKGKKKASRRFTFKEPEVKDIREKTGLSQAHFARLIGVSKRTLENWEQRRRHPTGPARALLKIVESDPKSAVQALHS